jgi:hypothetical protein
MEVGGEESKITKTDFPKQKGNLKIEMHLYV